MRWAKLGALLWFAVALLLAGEGTDRQWQTLLGARLGPTELVKIAVRYGFAFLFIVVGYGWWMRRSWGRWLALAIIAPVCVLAFGWLTSQQFVQFNDYLNNLGASLSILAILCAPVVWLLWRPQARAVFANAERPKRQFTLLGLLAAVLLAAIIMAWVRESVFGNPSYYTVAAAKRARGGDFDGAALLVERIRSPKYRDNSWGIIAVQLADSGDSRGSLEALRRISGDFRPIDGDLQNVVFRFHRRTPSEFKQFLSEVDMLEDRPDLQSKVRECLKILSRTRVSNPQKDSDDTEHPGDPQP